MRKGDLVRVGRLVYIVLYVYGERLSLSLRYSLYDDSDRIKSIYDESGSETYMMNDLVLVELGREGREIIIRDVAVCNS